MGSGSFFPYADANGHARVGVVFATRGASAGSNQDDVAVVPITSAWNYLLGGRNQIQQIFVQATSSGSTDAATSEINQVLLSRHHISDPNNADFRVLSQADILQTATQVTGVLTVLLGAIAAISLVV